MNGKATAGLIGMVVSVIVFFSPLLIASATTPSGGNMWSEGGDGGGSAIWLMILTVPLGGIAFIASLVMLIVGLATKR